MRVSFIGMSNIGKTHWAQRIAAEKGCDNINCDDLIEKKLKSELAEGGYRGIHGLADWMGFPFDPRYKRNSGLYLSYEKMALRETLDRLRRYAAISAVIDTTGSVIYTGDDILTSLRATTRVIYFEASEAHINDLFKRYIEHPKPVIWGDRYAPRDEETPEQALRRCYPELLRERARLYKEIAHMTIPFEVHRDHKADLAALIEEEASSL